jgi:hypothetical protein
MVWDNFTRIMQVTGAALGIPIAAAGVYSVYNTYFSTTTACQNLRGAIISTMERNVPSETKAILLKKDIAEFEKTCGAIDPDARSIFVAALQQLESQNAAPASSGAAVPAAKSRPALPALASFDTMQGDRRGWVTLGRRDAAGGELNFEGPDISAAALPAAGAILTARWPMPVWAEPPASRPDLTTARALVQVGTCVRVLSARAGGERLWLEVTPAPCL